MPECYKNENPGDGHEATLFLERAKATARMNGACILEFFTCPNPACGFQQIASHAFKEVVNCAECGQRMASCVPRLELPSEITRENIMEAIRLVRMAYPEVSPGTMEWVRSHDGAVQALGTAWACFEARRALDQVFTYARAMSGGHTA